jgi:hypothetical protein
MGDKAASLDLTPFFIARKKLKLNKKYFLT